MAAKKKLAGWTPRKIPTKSSSVQENAEENPRNYALLKRLLREAQHIRLLHDLGARDKLFDEVLAIMNSSRKRTAKKLAPKKRKGVKKTSLKKKKK